MLGSLPPIPALSSYCLEMAPAIADLVKIEFISFKKMYPSFLYPGDGLQNDDTLPKLNHPNVKVRQKLKWYNPLTWVLEGLTTRGDLLHAQWWSLPLAPIYLVITLLYKVKNKPVVFTVHNVLPHESSRLYGLICSLLFKWGDFFIVHATSNRENLIKNFSISPERIALIPHGPLDLFVPKDVEPEMVKKDLGFQPEHKVILFFGAIRSYKGLDSALYAFSKVIKIIPEARLLIAGKLWEDWHVYGQLISDLDIGEYILSCLEYIPANQVYRYFLASDLVILPYHFFDSQSGVGALAVAFRKPLIVTDVGGLPELQKSKCFVVPPGDHEILAQRIAMCLQDPQKLEEMKKNTEAVADEISWSNIAQQTWEVYQQVMTLNKKKKRTHGLFQRSIP